MTSTADGDAADARAFRAGGRPAGKDQETLERTRRIQAMEKLGLSVAAIAECEGCSERYVRFLKDNAVPAAAPDGDQPAEYAAPPRPRPMLRRTVQYRAWEYADRHPVFALGLAANSFWVRLVIAAHEDGDGFRLRVGDAGTRFRERGDLAVLLLGQLDPKEVKVDDWLAELFRRGRLLDLDGGDIGIPAGLGLTPGETGAGRLGGQAAKRRAASGPNRQQGEMLHLVPGGREDGTGEASLAPFHFRLNGTETPPPAEVKPEQKPLSGGSETPPAAEQKPVFGGSETLARPVLVVGSGQNDSNESPFLIATNNQNRAPERTHASAGGSETPPPAEQKPPGGGTETPPPAEQKPPLGGSETPLADLASEMKALLRPGAAATDRDLSRVMRWREDGHTAESMRAVIELRLKNPDNEPPRSLSYFDEAMRQALEDPRRPPGARPPPPRRAAPESEFMRRARMMGYVRDKPAEDDGAGGAPTIEGEPL